MHRIGLGLWSGTARQGFGDAPTLGGFWPGTRGENTPCTSVTTPPSPLENPVHSTVPAYLHPAQVRLQQAHRLPSVLLEAPLDHGER